MALQQWRGRLWLGPDYALLQGTLGPTAAHAHYAHQVLIAPEQPVTLSLDGVVQTTHWLLIESLRRHAIVEAPGEVLSVYAEPRLLNGGTLHRHLQGAECSLPGLEAALRQCPRQPLSDSRVSLALMALDNALTDKVPAATLAARAHLSLSQLERLFARDVGLPVRRLVLWRRLRLAMALVLAGQRVTDAAHGAGFADSAHFSRTLKSLFGVTAGQALQGLELRVLD